ncbi:hypothetical protein Vadar_028897 [Vaccinium darrowii]|uniref:Uncharacterized protein n=1 Tax=Vaccinium darrowii TaxID=229202 RepID=A0ACB7ZFH6_9ERIC|nr:hypothetical protein Vadar_028897 [Vaccinium darrowii]
MLLVFLLIILIITSQFEWKQPLVSDIDASPIVSQKQQQISNREEAVKEKIILSQEKNIQRLTELVRNSGGLEGTAKFPYHSLWIGGL